MGSVPGSHSHTCCTRNTSARDPNCLSQGQAAGGGERLTRDAPHSGKMSIPSGNLPSAQGTQRPQGMQVKGSVPGAHAYTTAPTSRGQRMPNCLPQGQAAAAG